MIPIHNRSSSRNGFRYDCFFVLVRYVLSYQRKTHPFGWVFLWLWMRTRRGRPCQGKAKKCPGDTFLARGRVHGWQAASGTGVDCHPFFCALGYEVGERSSPRKRGERCRWQIKRPERVAVVGGRRSRPVGKENTGHHNRRLQSFVPKGHKCKRISSSPAAYGRHFPLVDLRQRFEDYKCNSPVVCNEDILITYLMPIK